MKVKLTTKTDTILALNRLLEMIWDLPVSTDKRENVYKSIGYDLSEKIGLKAKNIIKKSELCKNKEISISLKYHEAWALEQIVTELLENFTDVNEYRNSLVNSFKDALNQKLA